jgi:hypothetical protein
MEKSEERHRLRDLNSRVGDKEGETKETLTFLY